MDEGISNEDSFHNPYVTGAKMIVGEEAEENGQEWSGEGRENGGGGG